ncbi:hypothetical protein GGR57DRAFT_107916 [Xylariaceae sp. FL1272]|nr:hypothetical protein GGR57DRAFT_107916 [Xylariaceae sp. FL1272]
MSVSFPATCPVLSYPQCPLMADNVVLGVYHAVDPSIYSDVYPENPDPRIREIADLIIEWYQLLIDMRYIDAEMVEFAPHKHNPIDLAKVAELGLTKDAVDMYQMIPYHVRSIDYFPGHDHTNWNFGSDGGEFLMWGESLEDMRKSDADWWRTAVDPFYNLEHFSPWHNPATRDPDAATRGWDDEDGPYMRPWYVTLTEVGNHGSVMILDTKTYEMWLINQGGGTSDPALEGVPGRNITTANENDLNLTPSRPAAEFLRDMISRFRTLEWIPGGLYNTGADAESSSDGTEEAANAEDGDDDILSDRKYYNNYKQLYEECGWPDKFNPLLFDKKRKEGGNRYSYWNSREEPSERAEEYKPLNHLYDHSMVNARERVQQQIHLADATYRLEHEMYDDQHERNTILTRKLNAECYLNPPFDEDQAGLRKEAEFRKADLEALRTRSGRYAGPGWAGVSDEEVRNMYEKALKDTRLAKLEARIQDTTLKDRIEREYREEKAAAAAVPATAWEAMAADYATWENDNWEGRWSILGSGTTLVDVKTVLDEDLSMEALESRIVYELEKNPDRSWRGERIWRNDGGKVAKVLEAPPKRHA